MLTNPGAQRRQSEQQREENHRKSRNRTILGIVLVFLAVLLGFNLYSSMQWKLVNTSEGMELLKNAQIERAEVTDGANQVKLWLKEDTKTVMPNGQEMPVGKQVRFQYLDPQGKQVAELLEKADIERGYRSIVPQQSFLSSLFVMLFPVVLILGVFYWIMRQQQSGRGLGLRDRNPEAEIPDVTFKDVAGEDEAVQEVSEVVDFLQNPDRYEKVGAKIPRGVLLYGPPGTGKTLIARAVAGEADVPFFSISASEFVELFVGMGASRVRELFKTAKKKSPSIIFIDEIDAVGRGRGVGMGGGNDEREQTLNQLLVEMDGFDSRDQVVLIAATNRPDVLDKALLRPGRFDRQIAVDAPDQKGREAILRVHAEGKPLGQDVELAAIAKRTPGFTGADLANILNEAALLAARHHREVITNADVDEASDRVMAGPQRRSRVMSPEDRRMTAYHEGGHALAAAALHHTDPVTKVTILPRGRALGYTMVMPEEDRYSVTRNQLLDQLTYALGGFTAEEVVFHDPSTGASNDIQKATETARKMVTEYGMSTKIGAVRLVPTEQEQETPAALANKHSEEVAAIIDAEVRELLETAHTEAWQIINENRDVLDHLAGVLLEKETVLEAELAEIFKNVRKAPKREVWLSDPNRPVSHLAPIPLPEAEPRPAPAPTAPAAPGSGSVATPGEAPAPGTGAAPTATPTPAPGSSNAPAPAPEGEPEGGTLA
ncbi:ATP-dependent zinc metalloprotease FtsH [Actinobaculum suis]|uniref:ATP-dependent zinc metalloprotease FtsH n=1 Tax=Actinobaculum suis TaxID=1657 RepID=UPI00389AAE30